jgi:hypothetical protein
MEAIQAYNKTAQQKIELRPTRDGRVGALLPLQNREVLVQGSMFKEDVRVGPLDIAFVAAEARLAMAPALALLDAALEAAGGLEQAKTAGA